MCYQSIVEVYEPLYTSKGILINPDRYIALILLTGEAQLM